MRGAVETIFGQPNLLRPVCDQRRRGQAGSISTLYGSEATKGVLAEPPFVRSKLHALAGKAGRKQTGLLCRIRPFTAVSNPVVNTSLTNTAEGKRGGVNIARSAYTTLGFIDPMLR